MLEIDSLAALFAEGKYAQAANLAHAMTQCAPLEAVGWKALGTALMLSGRGDQALAAMGKAAALAPDDAQTHYNLGILFKQAQMLPQAEAAYRRALELAPGDANAHYNLAKLLHEGRRLAEAESAYRRVLHLRPADAHALYNLGVLLQQTLQLPAAEAAYRRALELRPDDAAAHLSLGKLLTQMRRLPEAEAACRRALDLAPADAQAHASLGNLLRETRRLSAAEAAYRRALALEPTHAQTHNNLGSLLSQTRRLPQAEAAYRRALALAPEYVDAHNNLGVLLQQTGRPQEAEAAYERALELAPDEPKVRLNFGLLLLTLGRYAQAWPYYESRYDPRVGEPSGKAPDVPYPQWRGQSLAGKSLLLWPEQGLGDYIQFVRYAALLKQGGLTRLDLVCDPSLKPLLETVTGVDAVITDPACMPAHDYWSFPLSLPLHCGSTPQNLPAALPYVHALPQRLDAWRARLPRGKPRVGLVWQGEASHANDAHRSLPGLRALAPLWSVPGVHFVSLQTGPAGKQAANPPADQPIAALGGDIGDFADTAAIIAQLDLMICVDTAVAHLAGALGRPCWILVPALETDWRWGTAGTDCPWYPGAVRLFRQTVPGDWSGTIEAVAQELKAGEMPRHGQGMSCLRTQLARPG
jgi:tetratricopeptide (TPR) repeat protein